MQITSVRTTVVGTPWRDLVFVELETDDGLVGVGEVRPVNKTNSFVAVVEELAAPLRHRGRPVRHGAACLGDRAARVRPSERAWPVGAGGLRHRIVGPHRPEARRPRLEAARWPVPRPRPGVRQRLVPGRPGAGPDRGAGRGRRRPRLSGDEARPVRRGERPAGRGRAPAAMAVVAAVRDAIGPDIDLMIEMHGRFSPDTAAQIAARARTVRPTLDRGADPTRARRAARPRSRPPRT